MYKRLVGTKVKFTFFVALLLIVAALLTRITGTKPVAGGPVQNSISLVSHSPLGGPNARDEYLTLNVIPSGGNAISLTGIRISDGKIEITLGSGVALFEQGQINAQTPIVITRASNIVISSGRSPLGVSFRENKCTGLLSTFQEFTLPLTPACADCVEKKEGYPDYNACVKDHMSDSDFFGDLWRIYIGSDETLWHDKFAVLRLYDTNNKLIALLPIR